MLQSLETAGLSLYWGLVPLYTFICISQMCQGKEGLETFKNALQILLWVLQESQSYWHCWSFWRWCWHEDAKTQLPVGEMVWEKGTLPSSSLASFVLYLSASVSNFFSHPFPKWCGCNITDCTHWNALSLEGDIKCLSSELLSSKTKPSGSSSHLYRLLICQSGEIQKCNPNL